MEYRTASETNRKHVAKYMNGFNADLHVHEEEGGRAGETETRSKLSSIQRAYSTVLTELGEYGKPTLPEGALIQSRFTFITP